jgi:hypothetical protein
MKSRSTTSPSWRASLFSIEPIYRARVGVIGNTTAAPVANMPIDVTAAVPIRSLNQYGLRRSMNQECFPENAWKQEKLHL